VAGGNVAKRDTELIPREAFREMISQGKVVRTPASRGGVVHEVLKVLEKNAATVEAIAEMLKVQPKTVVNAINHLRHRYNKKIARFYNPKDRKYYYYLEE
jgi:transcription initiation factor IIE alpha subunit